MRAVPLLLLLALAGACSSAPGVERCVPQVGSVGGGEDVTVEGRGFAQGAIVHLGHKQARVGSLRDGKIEIKTPPCSEVGPVDVVVTQADGRTLVLRQGFRYQESRVLPMPAK
ncbi:MAG: IPT/TIG domain-containing protein [Myxococcota bacterium]